MKPVNSLLRVAEPKLMMWAVSGLFAEGGASHYRGTRRSHEGGSRFGWDLANAFKPRGVENGDGTRNRHLAHDMQCQATP